MDKTMAQAKIFNGVYRGKRVLVTGHTGFKGAWLTEWLMQLGADVTGYSAYLPSDPCLFGVLGLQKRIRHIKGDVRDVRALAKAFQVSRPQVVFHLAAQPIVRTAYAEPKRTFDTNLGGTVNVLECLRASSSVRAAVIITSDKCYENLGLNRGYHENDRLGGADPYSASKACAEIAASAYFRSFLFHQDRLRIATVRAGNVIGGGDWAQDRIVPDCVRAWSRGKTAIVRSPKATRPWQHVLEPISGYLWLAASLFADARGANGESFNFGPRQKASHSVGELADLFLSYWGEGQWTHVPSKGKKEALLLQLSPRKTARRLGWSAALSFRETVQFTADWYRKYYKGPKKDMREFTRDQISEYIQHGRKQGLAWAGRISQ